jgi:predicted RNA-binding Zn-ribbon protein involved in translation (DUF1610 family)
MEQESERIIMPYCSYCRTKLECNSKGVYICPQCGLGYVKQEENIKDKSQKVSK